jgi:hypothetical protein
MAITVVDGLTLDTTHDALWEKRGGGGKYQLASLPPAWMFLYWSKSMSFHRFEHIRQRPIAWQAIYGISGMSYPVFSGNLEHFQVMNVISSGTATMTSTTSVDAESSAFISVRFSSADPFHRAGSDEATETNSIIDQHGKRDTKIPRTDFS